jgi:4-amino-4-deoxy-L-arabinose transferase-like glycosyltransferase
MSALRARRRQAALRAPGALPRSEAPPSSAAQVDRASLQTSTLPRHWESAGLAGVLLLASGLSLFRLDQQGYGNTYYAAAVKSMLTSWHALFFVAYDPAGYLAVDKPPLGLWIQALSARLLGFTGVSLFLPQVLAGIVSVALLFYLVRRAYGPVAGLLAALALALMPINAVTNRNNTVDSQLICILLLATWAASVAAERGRLGWLLGSAALVGLGYNVKMLQAYPVLPGFWLAYLLWAPLGRWVRLGHLALASALLLAVSLSWSLVVDLTPPAERPYVGQSGDNSAIGLALGYNGLGHVLSELNAYVPLYKLVWLGRPLSPGPVPGIGSPGPLRLFRAGVPVQVSWLLPLAGLGLLVACWRAARPRPKAASADEAATDLMLRRQRLRRQRIALTIWGGWLLAWGAYFSFGRFFHLFYLTMLGPPIAALAGLGTVVLWRLYRQDGWLALGLPLGLAGTAAAQLVVLSGVPEWSRRLSPLIGLCCLAAASTLAWLAWRRRRTGDRPRPAAGLALGAAGLGFLALLVAPTVWAVIGILNRNGGAWLPEAGPVDLFNRSAGRPGVVSAGPGSQAPGLQKPGSPGAAGPLAAAYTFAGPGWNVLDPGLVHYLLVNQGSARFLVATPTATFASLFMLATDQPALALGGYQGWDRILTPAQLAQQVQAGLVRFFLLDAPGTPPRPGAENDQTADLATWVHAHCAEVPPERWQAYPASAPTASSAMPPPTAQPSAPATSFAETQRLYDCRPDRPS